MQPNTHRGLDGAVLPPRTVTRREALALLMGTGVAALSNALAPALASAETTQEKLDAAQLSYDQAQEELEKIAQEYASIASTLSDTMSQVSDLSGQITSKQSEIESKQAEVDAKQSEVDAKQSEIDETQKEIEAKQKLLGKRMSAAYKSGTASTIDLLLSATSFDELTSNIYYLDKISASDQQIISEVKDLKTGLETQKAELETQKAALEDEKSALQTEKSDLEVQKSDLEGLQVTQEQQLAEAQAKQEESESLVSSLSSEVQTLVAQRDAELLAAQQAAEAARQQRNSSSGSSSAPVIAGASDKLQAVVNAAYSVASPGSGLCAAWVSRVFAAAGLDVGGGNACDMYDWYCQYSTSDIQPGMIIATRSAPYSSAAMIYGHVGIYVGNNTVRDNASGRLRTSTLSGWISEYNITSTVRCGWLGNITLS